MPALLLALALFAQDAAPAAADPPAAPEAAWPIGAPRDDYGLVSWCYGALDGYLALHEQVMPEVTRIETTYRRPGSDLKQDLKVYSDLQTKGRANLKLFARAMEAAEKASPRPLNAAGAEAMNKGRATWAAAPSLSKARLAQEWMSWALPARCETTAESLEKRASLMGATFDLGAPPAEGDSRLTDPAPEAPAPDAAAS